MVSVNWLFSQTFFTWRYALPLTEGLSISSLACVTRSSWSLFVLFSHLCLCMNPNWRWNLITVNWIVMWLCLCCFPLQSTLLRLITIYRWRIGASVLLCIFIWSLLFISLMKTNSRLLPLIVRCERQTDQASRCKAATYLMVVFTRSFRRVH